MSRVLVACSLFLAFTSSPLGLVYSTRMRRSSTSSRDTTFDDSLMETEKNQSFRRWTRQRLDTLRETVTAHDVLRYFGTELKAGGSTAEEQISCPFHGDDRKPSARVYPQHGPSHSGVYCWTCQKRWDIVALWKNFHGDEAMKFTAALRGLEKAFGIVPPDAPEFDIEADEPEVDHEKLEAVERLLQVCENRLREAKPSFDMRGFLTVGKLLDGLYFAIDNELLPLEDVEARARLVLNKVGEKMRNA